MKTKFLKFYSGILSSILVLLGFAACSDDDDDDGPIICEYGVPSALYKVKGSVVSKEDQKPVRNIRAILVETREGEESFYGDTIKADAEGKFDLELRAFPSEKATFNLKLDDVDGAENGTFDEKIIEVVFDKPKLTGGDGWYKGETTKDIGKIELDPSDAK